MRRPWDVMIAGLGITACMVDPPPPSPAVAASPSPAAVASTRPCQVTLEKYCAGPCLDYTQQVDRLRAGCATKPASSFKEWEERCPGSFSSIRTASPTESHQSYFDAKGNLIGAVTTADYQRFCDGTSFSLEAGTRPTCPRPLETEPLCPG